MKCNVDIFKDDSFLKPLVSIKVEKAHFERMDHFLRQVVNQLEDEGIILDRKEDDLHSLILVDAIGFETEEPVKGEVMMSPAGSDEQILIVTNVSKFSLGIPESMRK